VTAGVYLIARSSLLFALSPVASLTVAVVGALTALFAATIGLKQWDIKKVLAYSTVSQLGYMFVGVGVGAYTAGVFHLVTHAFFKALLFLGSGSVIYAMHQAYHATHSHDDAQDMRNMGGLRPYLPYTFALMWIATLAISGIPPFAGFFSKDEILGSVFARAEHSTLADASWLWIPGRWLLFAIYVMGLVTALMTAVYMTRMMLYTFHGPNRTGERERGYLREAPWIMTGPLMVLGVLSAVGGVLNLPHVFTHQEGALARWLDPVVGRAQLRVAGGEAPEVSATTEYILIGAAVAIAAAGIPTPSGDSTRPGWCRRASTRRSAGSSACWRTSTTSTRGTTGRSSSPRSASPATCSGEEWTSRSSTGCSSTGARGRRGWWDGSAPRSRPATSEPTPGCCSWA
jgi:NADH-quinone oxidoreductase subunit L